MLEATFGRGYDVVRTLLQRASADLSLAETRPADVSVFGAVRIGLKMLLEAICRLLGAGFEARVMA